MRRKALALNGVLAVAVLGIGTAGYVAVSSSKSTTTTTTTTVPVKKGTVLISVTASGNLSAPSQLDVNFTTSAGSNPLTAILVKVGDKVTKGQPLAKVDDTSLKVAAQVAQAQVASAQASLDKLTAGLTAADKASLAAQKVQLSVSLANAQDAVTNAQSSLDNDTTTQNALVATAQANLDAATGNAIAAAQTALDNATKTRDTKLAADQQALTNAQRQLTTTKANNASSAAAIAAKEAGATTSDLTSAQAAVAQAQNSAVTAQKNLDNATLVAPSDGTVTALNANAKVGANPPSGANANAFVTLTDLSGLQVKAGFTEADAVKVKVGQAVTIGLDALGTGTTTTGKVISVDSVSTLVSNVVTYYVYILLDAPPAGAKPGMTASVSVVVDKAENVLYLPAAALTARGTNATVNVQDPTDPKKYTATQVTIGLKGDQGTEIKTGLKEGDVIVIIRTSATGTGTNGGVRLPTAAGGVAGIGGGGAPVVVGAGGGGAPGGGGGRG